MTPSPADAEERSAAGEGPRRARGRRRIALIGAVGIGGLVAAGYVATAASAGDDLPPGSRVAGVPLGGLSPAAAQTRLERALTDRAGLALPVAARLPGNGLVPGRLTPAAAGLRVDAAASVRPLRRNNWNPVVRWQALLGTTRNAEPVVRIDRPALAAALVPLERTLPRGPREGEVRYDGLQPVVVPPDPGQRIDLDAAADRLRAGWLAEPRPTLALPVVAGVPRASRADLAAVAAGPARAAVAAPVTLTGGQSRLVVTPADVAAALRWRPDPEGRIRPSLDEPRLTAALRPRLAALGRLPRNARVVLAGGPEARRIVIIPSATGREVAAERLPSIVLPLLAGTDRAGSLPFRVVAPALSTERARALGVREEISSFTTYHPCCANRVVNIHRIADLVDGTLVLPGETYSLNGRVGQRDLARGFLPAPMIDKGRFVNAVGGGISQFATTLYNAVFFAGLEQIEHRAHSYYFTRYPPGREATVSWPKPELIWRNDSPYGVLIDTSHTSRSITVRFWSTKRWEVTAEVGARTRPTTAPTRFLEQDDCIAASGAPGFTITVVRVIKQRGVVLRREPTTTVYQPQPEFVCGPDPATLPPSPTPSPSPGGAPGQPAPPVAEPPLPVPTGPKVPSPAPG
jgi:vancomycin resistance protein YoaR